MRRKAAVLLSGLGRIALRCLAGKPRPRPGRILVVKTHAIGDLLMVTPSIRALRTLYPDAHIAVLVGRWSAPVLENNPDIDEVIDFPDEMLFGGRVYQLPRLILEIRARQFDLAAVFQPSGAVQLLVALARVPQRIGFDLDGSGFSLTRRLAWSPNSERFIGDNYMDIPRSLGFSAQMPESVLVVLETERRAAFEKYLAGRVEKGRPLIALCPGGGRNPRDVVSAKVWPHNHFAAVARTLASEYSAKVMVLGGPGDEQTCEAVCRNAAVDCILPRRTTLRELAALISLSALVITNDSAPVHIAAALGVPCIGLYGPSNPKAVAPRVPTHRTIKSTAPCSPCYSNQKFPGCRKPNCMAKITVESVLEAARNLLLNSAANNDA